MSGSLVGVGVSSGTLVRIGVGAGTLVEVGVDGVLQAVERMRNMITTRVLPGIGYL